MGARNIAGKDLRQLIRDRRALAVLIAMPMVFIAVLGVSTGRLMGWRAEQSLLRVSVLDLSDNSKADEIVADLRQRKGVVINAVQDESMARRRVDDGDSVAVLIIGSEFGTCLERMTPGDLMDLLRSSETPGIAQLDMHVYTPSAQPGLRGIVEQLIAVSTFATLLPDWMETNPVTAALLRTGERSGELKPRTDSNSPEQEEESQEGGIYQFIVPGYTVMFAFFLINIMARSFLAERQSGTLVRLRMAPISSWQITAGKVLPFLIISLIQGLLLFAFGRLLFDMSWGAHPWLLVLVIACTSAAATTLGLVIAVVVKSDAQVSAYANLLVITLAAISGCFMPRAWLPEVMRSVSLATPHAWSLIAYDQLLNSAHPDVSRVYEACIVLSSFALALLLVGCNRFRRLANC